MYGDDAPLIPFIFVADTQCAWITSLRLTSNTGSDTKPGIPLYDVRTICVTVEATSASHTPYNPASLNFDHEMHGYPGSSFAFNDPKQSIVTALALRSASRPFSPRYILNPL